MDGECIGKGCGRFLDGPTGDRTIRYRDFLFFLPNGTGPGPADKQQAKNANGVVSLFRAHNHQQSVAFINITIDRQEIINGKPRIQDLDRGFSCPLCE